MTLTTSGYLHATRGRGGGTFVVEAPPVTPPPSAKQAAGWSDTCDERLAIELGVVALAANRATPATIEPLKRLAAALESCADDPLRYCQLDRQFHVAIAKVTGSNRLIIASTRVQALIFDLMSAMAPSPEQRERSDTGHQAIIDALAAADEQAAIRAMSNHLSETRSLLERTLARQGSATMASTAT
jgi:DNA-binding FadR family transcriptional regulator